MDEQRAMGVGAMQLGPKLVVEVTVHDWIAKMSLGGVGR